MKRILTAAALLAAVTTMAAGQTQTAPINPDKIQSDAIAKERNVNCPPNNPSNSQSVEKSAIVPDAKSDKNSAAETVQRDNKTAEADANCNPKPPDQKN
jgi:hypothetical protein